MHTRSFAPALRAFLVLGLAFLLGGTVLLVAGCSDSQPTAQGSSSSSAKRASSGPLRIGVQYNALSLPTVFADENDYFSDVGLDVEVYTYANGAEENKAIERGDIDIASDGLASVYMLATGKFKWIGESDSGSSTVGVYVRKDSPATLISGQVPNNPNVKGSADTLRGVTVLGPAGTMEEWVAVSYFSQFGLLAGQDYEFVEMDRAQAADSVIEGRADVFVATDADYARLMEENGFVALAEGAEATWVPFNNGYLASNEVVEQRYEEVLTFLSVVYQAAEELNADSDLRNDFAFEYYRANGKPTMRADVQKETEVRPFLVPADFTAPDYRLGSGVLEVGRFNASIGALQDNQVLAIENSIDPKLLDEAFGIDVQPAMIGDGLQSGL